MLLFYIMLNRLQNKILLFLVFCMGVRVGVALLAKYIDKTYLQKLGYLLLLPAMGFIIVYIGGLRGKGGLNQIAWWNHLRPVHSLLYFIAAFYAIKKDRRSWIVLLLDAGIGLMAFLVYHFLLI